MILQESAPTIFKSEKNRRLREFDALRGFSILLVVYSHILLVAGLGGDITFLGKVITSFYMPLFFYISGFFAWQSLNITKFKIFQKLSLKFKGLVVSSIVFFTLLNYTRSADIFGWLSTGFRSYWFTIVLFQMFVIYYASLSISKLVHHNISIAIMIILSFLALGIVRSHILHDLRIAEILDIANLCFFLQFFTFGIICRKYLEKFIRIISNNVMITAFIIAFVLIFCLIQIPAVSNNELVIQLINTFITTYIGILLFISLFYVSRQYFKSTGIVQNCLCRWGQRSLDIYMLHFFFLPNLLFLEDFLRPNNMILFQIIIGFSFSIFVIILCIIISNCVRKSSILSEWLFGTKVLK